MHKKNSAQNFFLSKRLRYTEKNFTEVLADFVTIFVDNFVDNSESKPTLLAKLFSFNYINIRRFLQIVDNFL